jgi:hypothetical protein
MNVRVHFLDVKADRHPMHVLGGGDLRSLNVPMGIYPQQTHLVLQIRGQIDNISMY